MGVCLVSFPSRFHLLDASPQWIHLSHQAARKAARLESKETEIEVATSAQMDGKKKSQPPAKQPRAPAEKLTTAKKARISKEMDPREQLRGKSFRIPQSVWPKETLPAAGYWVAEFVKFADRMQNVWLVSEGQKFWVATSEAASWEVHEM